MTGDFFTRLSQQVHGEEPAVRPIIPSRFAYGPVLNPEGSGDFAENGNEEELSIFEVTEPDRDKSEKGLPAPMRTDQNISSENPSIVLKHNQNWIKTTPASHEAAEWQVLQNRQASDRFMHEPQKGSYRDYQAVQTRDELSPLVSKKIKSDNEAAGRQPDLKKILPHTVRSRRASVKRELPAEAGRRFPADYPPPEPNPFESSKKESNKGTVEATPTIRVSIGRIEVRAVTPAPSTRRPAPKRPGPSLTLDAYLKQRNAGRR